MERAGQETRWVLRAQAGDREALDDLLRAVQGPLFGYVRGLVGERPLAEDVLQDVFLLIYRNLRFLREPELFRPWAYRIATRAAFKALRKERRWSEQVRDEAVLEALPARAPGGAQPDLVARLPELVGRVSPASRAVLLLHYLHEMPLDEVADVLGIAPGTARSRLAYGLEGLRKELRRE
jgi:RNA polymerase sigma-70 factor (ECF subfamily)